MLGVYLVVLSCCQFVVYAWLSQITGLDPRVGISMVVERMLGGSHQVTEASEWTSALWLLGVAILFVSGKNIFKTYVVSEVVLAIPTVVAEVPFLPSLFFGSFGWFTVTVLVFVLFTAIPVGLAIFLVRRGTQFCQGSKW